MTRADLFQRPGERTPVFVRFSTVAGNKGSFDLARDVRGFAVKFYTQEGNWDLVGNNIPVFFIQDAIKFPDLVHAVKQAPDRGFPQAQSAHDNFWDFISLMPEATHMVMWTMSDRAIPRSFRFMEGFGVHTFRFVNAAGDVDVRQVPLEAEARHAVGGVERGRQDQRRRPRLPPPRPVGRHQHRRLPGVGARRPAVRRRLRRRVRLRRPRRHQDHPRGARAGAPRSGGWCSTARSTTSSPRPSRSRSAPRTSSPGIDFTNDPLLQGRNFSYLDTQLKRLGGPNFTHLPVNAPKCPVAHFQQDGHMAMTNPVGRVNYEPNSWSATAGPARTRSAGSRPSRRPMDGPKQRVRSERFADHFSQARQFLVSQTPVEQQHIVNAFVFELSKCEQPGIRARMVANLRNVDEDLATPDRRRARLPAFPDPTPPARAPITDLPPSPALSIVANGPATLRRAQDRRAHHRRHRRRAARRAAQGGHAPRARSSSSSPRRSAAPSSATAPCCRPTRRSTADRRCSTTPSPSWRRATARRCWPSDAAAKDFVTDAHAHCKFVAYHPDAVAAAARRPACAEQVDDGYVELGGRAAVDHRSSSGAATCATGLGRRSVDQT